MDDPPDRPVLEVTSANFEREVLLRSREVPVLVDFWAAWCAPCRTLGPILEKLARELAGRLVLAKIDIDRSPELAEAFRVSSVPTVVLLKQGQLVEGFLGVRPEAEIRALLEPHLEPASQGVLERAAALEAEGQSERAIAELRAHLRTQVDDGAARVVLARLLLDAGRVEEARLVRAKLGPQDLESDAGRALCARLDFQERAGDLAELARRAAAEPTDVAARLAHGQALVAAGRREQGLEELLEAARLDLHHDGDAPRKALIEVFAMLGWEDPLTLEYQRRLSMLLTA